MGAQENVGTIERVYEAFGRGDVGTILDAVADEVDWDGERRGKDGVASFFADIAGASEVLDFAVEGIGASDGAVFAFLRFGARLKATGREVAFHLHHYFRFDAEGKIEYYRGSEDSAQVARALAD